MPSNRKSGADHRRLIVLALCLTFGFSVIVAQLGRYQVLKHAELKEEAIGQRNEEFDVSLPRSEILDRNGHYLALSTTQWDISVSPSLVMDPEELADDMAALLGRPREEIYAILTADVPWMQVARYIPQDVGEAIARLDTTGLECIPHPKRVYPNGPLFAHTLGIVTLMGDGFYGVEGYHNQVLKGSQGKEQGELDPFGIPLPLPFQTQDPAQLGSSLILTLDRNIQFIVKEELVRALETFGAESGTIIVMDPRTGAILANVSYPTYDPNDFVGTEISLLADPAVSSMWEPGSIFKIITWGAGLDTGTISPGTTFYDDGSMEVGGRTIQNWDRQGHGLVDMTGGLVESLNTVAAFISTSVGKEQFYTYLRRFGFGSLTDVDLASEGPGMMKLPGDSNWFPSELGTNSFGQGIAVTPIQMIAAVSAVANHGVLMKPHIVDQYLKDEENGDQRIIQVEPTIVRRAISEETAATLTQMLVAVIEQGATEAQVPGYRIAGKTGTAQIPTAYGYHPSDTIASFVGYAPADDPQFIVLVKLDKPQTSPWGSQTAAPTFRAIAKRLFVYMHIPPDDIRLAQR
jgi:cell division protein FtsI/penicillin-binding protein 2